MMNPCTQKGAIVPQLFEELIADFSAGYRIGKTFFHALKTD